MWTPGVPALLGMVGVLLMMVKDSDALECFYCRGYTYYDPNNCFAPNHERTFMQECRTKDEVCEKKLVRIDGWTRKVERGCSANCAGRDFIWTEDFKVHCCRGNGCNGVGRLPLSISLTFSLPLIVCVASWLNRRL